MIKFTHAETPEEKALIEAIVGHHPKVAHKTVTVTEAIPAGEYTLSIVQTAEGMDVEVTKA